MLVNCPACQSPTSVVESRAAEAGAAVRRRRECEACGRRFTTYERAAGPRLFVRKRDGARQPFNREKLLEGLMRAAHKRPVAPADAAALADRIAAAVERAGGELAAERVGEMALAGLGDLDRIAYLQFAAVYHGFDDPRQLADEVRRLGARSGARRSPQTAASVPAGSVRLADDHPELPPKGPQEREKR